MEASYLLEYIRHYKHRKGEHYCWRDFEITFISNKKEWVVESAMEKIMAKLLGKGVIGFGVSEIKSKDNNEFDDNVDRWMVIDLLRKQYKYPKGTHWGEYKGGLVIGI